MISPEGCASILWKSSEKAPDAAAAMNLTAEKIYALGGIIDRVVPEPLGGAHRDFDGMAKTLKRELLQQLRSLQALPVERLLAERYKRIMSYGQ